MPIIRPRNIAITEERSMLAAWHLVQVQIWPSYDHYKTQERRTVGQNRKKLLLNQFLSCSILLISMFNLKVDISMLSTLGRILFFHIQNWSSVLSKLSHAQNQVIPGACKIVGKIIWCISAHNFLYFFNLYQRLFRFYIHPESPKLC